MKGHFKFLISLFYLIVIAIKSLLLRILLGRSDCKLLTLNYHSIPNDQKANFIWQLKILRKIGEIVPIDFTVKNTKTKRFFKITFDDGFESIINNAVPYLESNNIPYAVFIPTAYMGKVAKWQHYNGKNNPDETIINKNQILKLNKDLAIIGSHSAHHLKFTTIPYDQRLIELKESKEVLEDLLNIEIPFLSIPYGEYDNKLVELARNVGYSKIYSSEPEFTYNNSGNDNFLNGRVSVCPDDSRIKFIIKILGGYNWSSKYFRLKRKIKPVLSKKSERKA